MVSGRYLIRSRRLDKKAMPGSIRIQAEFLFIMMDTGLKQELPQLDQLVLRESLDLPALSEPLALQENLDPPEQQEPLEPQAQLVIAVAQVLVPHGG
jgi:hypothetical protein